MEAPRGQALFVTTPVHVLSMVGAPGERCVIVAPATTLKAAPMQLIRRLVGRIRAGKSVSSPRERVVWDAPSVGIGRIDVVRERVLRGEIHVHRSPMSPLGAIRELAHFTPVDEVRVGASGGLRQLGTAGSRSVILRLGTVASPGDPGTHYRALERFSEHRVPSPLGSGTFGSVRWSVESLLPGHRPNELDDALLDEVSRFLASLPRPAGAVESLGRAASTLGQFGIPGFGAEELAQRLEQSLDSLPTVPTHGDLWTGNLLEDGGMLSGVIDWDSWSERGVPGTDLIHLHAEQQRRSERSSYGAVIETRFWERSEVSVAVSRHMNLIGATWRTAQLTDLAIAWWMTTIAGAVRRSPGLLTNNEWIAANVMKPLRVFGIGTG